MVQFTMDEGADFQGEKARKTSTIENPKEKARKISSTSSNSSMGRYRKGTLQHTQTSTSIDCGESQSLCIEEIKELQGTGKMKKKSKLAKKLEKEKAVQRQ